ncbi:MAG: hypothetical protein H6505_01985 [Calditrichaeota bacterium]|nr:hypothetical protein [Calditrichota bacterium]
MGVCGHVVQIHCMLPERGLQTPPEPHGEQKLSHYSNYFFGRDSSKWRSRVAHYERVVVPEVWPGIDVEYRADSTTSTQH